MDNVINYYNNYDEDGRLFRDNCHRMEYITTIHFFEKLFPKGLKILDACAGTGNYSFKLAQQGHKVTAGDIVPSNVDIIRRKNSDNPILQDIYTGSVTELKQFRNDTFDIVLCMGAFYHMKSEGRNKALEECLRVLKPEGYLVVSYINSIAVTIASLSPNLENINDILDWFHRKTDNVFEHMTPDEVEKTVKEFNVGIVAHIAADGFVYALKDKLNNASKENYEQWVNFHLAICEDRSILGGSLHGLVILKKM